MKNKFIISIKINNYTNLVIMILNNIKIKIKYPLIYEVCIIYLLNLIKFIYIIYYDYHMI